MAKKTVKVDLKSAGAEPAAGDVNISYKGSRIAGLSESSTAVLETENTIVQDDIEVEYTKPEPKAITIPLFTVVGRGGAVFVKDISGIPGSVVNETITTPTGAVSFKRVNANWRVTMDGASTEIRGYMPDEFSSNNVTIEYAE